jgi:hypothetical protein
MAKPTDYGRELVTGASLRFASLHDFARRDMSTRTKAAAMQTVTLKEYSSYSRAMDDPVFDRRRENTCRTCQ